jgi:spermidine synthase
MGEKMVRQGILDVTVFVCGAVVMTYEIIGSRVLSPFIGASTYVWTSLIGVILAALSLGYWLGGRMADRTPAVGVLASVIFIAAGLISLTVLIKEIVLSMVASAPVGIELRAVIASIILFAPTSICLGFVPPYVVKLRMLSLDDAGKTVGRLYALSTVGSIIGTFAAGFLLIPFVGSVRTLYGLSAILILLSLALVPFAISRAKIAVIIVFAFSIVANEASVILLRQANDLHDIDTEYSRVQVFTTNDPKTGRPVRAMATDPYFTQSAMFFDSDEHVFDYTRYYHLARHFRPDFREVLMIGGAGYTVPKDFLRRYPEANIDVVEIDPQMTAIAERFFELKPDPRLTITHEDGRTFLRRTAAARYDVIMMDAFGSLFSVPYQLTTLEAVSEMHRSLREDGIVIFNLGSAITGPASRFLHAELATYRAVFPNVHLFKVNAERTDETLQNLIIVATRSPAAADLTTTDPDLAKYLANLYPITPNPNAQMITDDLAPVEYYNAVAQNVFLRSLR